MFSFSEAMEKVKAGKFGLHLKAEADDMPTRIVISAAEEKAAEKAMTFSGYKNYRILYRGTHLDSTASVINYRTEYPTFWSQDKEWATEFAENAVISIPYNQQLVLLDMNVIPFSLAPDLHREPELILKEMNVKAKLEDEL